MISMVEDAHGNAVTSMNIMPTCGRGLVLALSVGNSRDLMRSVSPGSVSGENILVQEQARSIATSQRDQRTSW